MKVLIKNQFFSMAGSSKVLNENKEPIYNVKGKFLSLKHKKRVCDLDGHVLYRVQNRLFNPFSHVAYILDQDKKRVAKIIRKAYDVKGNFEIEGLDSDMIIEGNFFGLTSKILKNGETLGTITRDLNMFEDHYTLEANEQDIPFLIALVIAVDNITDSKSRRTR